MHVKIIHRTAKQRGLRTIENVVRVGHIPERINEIRHIIQVVFYLFVKSVNHQAKVDEVHVPVIQVGIDTADRRGNIRFRQVKITANFFGVVKGLFPIL